MYCLSRDQLSLHQDPDLDVEQPDQNYWKVSVQEHLQIN